MKENEIAEMIQKVVGQDRKTIDKVLRESLQKEIVYPDSTKVNDAATLTAFFMDAMKFMSTESMRYKGCSVLGRLSSGIGIILTSRNSEVIKSFLTSVDKYTLHCLENDFIKKEGKQNEKD